MRDGVFQKYLLLTLMLGCGSTKAVGAKMLDPLWDVLLTSTHKQPT